MQDLAGCRLRPAAADDAQAILQLINVVQPALSWSSQDYEWQLLDGPVGPARVRVVECDNRIAALYVATRKRFRIDGRLVEACMVQDVMTHPEFRGRGFLNYMASAFKAEMRAWGVIGFTFPNKFSENSFRRTSWTELCRVPLRIAAVSPSSQAGLLLPVEGFDDNVVEIWDESGFRAGVHRDATFLRWRYGRPATTYHRFIAEDNAGFVVLKVYDQPDSRVVHICDLVVKQRAGGLLGHILSEVHGFASASGASTLTCWLPQGHLYAGSFAAAGFMTGVETERFVFVDGPADLMPTLANPASWHLSQGDSDVY